MVYLIIGHKGSGKTKHLIEEVNKAVDVSMGNVICVEKDRKLTFDIDSRVRLVAADDYAVSGYESYYGFLAGMCASNSDVTDILCDGTLKIGGKDQDAMATFFKNIKALGDNTDTKFVFTLSADEDELPAAIFDVCKKI